MKALKKLDDGLLAARIVLELIAKLTKEGRPSKIQLGSIDRSLDDLREIHRHVVGENFAIRGRLVPSADWRRTLHDWAIDEKVDFSLNLRCGEDSVRFGKIGPFLALRHEHTPGLLERAVGVLIERGVGRKAHHLNDQVTVEIRTGYVEEIIFRGPIGKVGDLIQELVMLIPGKGFLEGEVSAPLAAIEDLAASGQIVPDTEDYRWFLSYSGRQVRGTDVQVEAVPPLVKLLDRDPGLDSYLFFEDLTWKLGEKVGREPSVVFTWAKERDKPAVIRVTSIDPLPKTWITALTVAAEEIVTSQEGIL